MALVGHALAGFTDFRASLTGTFHKGPGRIPWGDVVLPYVASLATGCSDNEALHSWVGKACVTKALRVVRMASPETLGQHLDDLADAFLDEALGRVTQATLDLLQRSSAPLTPCATATSRQRRSARGWARQAGVSTRSSVPPVSGVRREHRTSSLRPTSPLRLP